MCNKLTKLLSFGRKKVRKLPPEKEELINAMLNNMCVQTIQDIQNFVSQYKSVNIEIGFGNGEFIAKQAKENQEVAFIGCEPFINGTANLLKLIKENNITNIRIWADDGRILLEKLPSSFVNKIFILFPDPWPKIKHHKRRLINENFLKILERILTSDGSILIVTDHEDYASHILQYFMTDINFIWHANTYRDWQDSPAFWIKTRYQIKAEKLNIKPIFLTFYKNLANTMIYGK